MYSLTTGLKTPMTFENRCRSVCGDIFFHLILHSAKMFSLVVIYNFLHKKWFIQTFISLSYRNSWPQPGPRSSPDLAPPQGCKERVTIPFFLFYFCWSNSTSLLNSRWEHRIKGRGEEAGDCVMEVTCSCLLCGTRQRWPNAHSQRILPFFIMSNTTFCLSSSVTLLLNLLHLSIPPSNLTLSVFLTNPFPVYNPAPPHQ